MTLSEEQFAEMMKKARAHDADLQRCEADHGFAPPKRVDLREHLRTAEAALECAVKVGDWQIVCEGIVLLQQAIARVSPIIRGSGDRRDHH